METLAFIVLTVLTIVSALIVVLPSTTEQVSDILRYCHDNNVKIVPRGGGTSLSGGALPAADAISLF